jgi:hypothetical protein
MVADRTRFERDREGDCIEAALFYLLRWPIGSMVPNNPQPLSVKNGPKSFGKNRSVLSAC